MTEGAMLNDPAKGWQCGCGAVVRWGTAHTCPNKAKSDERAEPDLRRPS